MTDSVAPETQPSPDSGVAERFFSDAIPRMTRLVLLLGTVFALAVAWRWGWIVAAGFATGVLVAYWSFRSLSKAVQALAGRIVEKNSPERGFTLVHGFFLRYLLAGGIAYVIFTSSSQAFRGFLFGLCTPVGAMLLEAVVEAFAALRRGY
jgi:hypothetical protein